MRNPREPRFTYAPPMAVRNKPSRLGVYALALVLAMLSVVCEHYGWLLLG